MSEIQRKFEISLEGGEPRWPEDCQRIVNVAASIGISMTPKQAERIWDYYSDNFYSAGWIRIRDDTHIIEGIQAFIDRRDS